MMEIVPASSTIKSVFINFKFPDAIYYQINLYFWTYGKLFSKFDQTFSYLIN